jgi:hypothetical protein
MRQETSAPAQRPALDSSMIKDAGEEGNGTGGGVGKGCSQCRDAPRGTPWGVSGAATSFDNPRRPAGAIRRRPDCPCRCRASVRHPRRPAGAMGQAGGLFSASETPHGVPRGRLYIGTDGIATPQTPSQTTEVTTEVPRKSPRKCHGSPTTENRPRQLKTGRALRHAPGEAQPATRPAGWPARPACRPRGAASPGSCSGGLCGRGSDGP